LRLAPIYGDLNAGKWPRGVVSPSEWHEQRLKLLIKTLGVRQLLPFLLASASARPSEFATTLESLERAAFVALVCFENQTGWGEKTFELAAQVYSKGASEEEYLASMREFFALRLLDPAQRFAARLPERLRYANNRKTMIRYFLTTINDWGFPEVASPWSQPDIQANWVLSDIHIDHISAQRGTDPIDAQERDRLGNLAPLKGRSNMALSNKPFNEKQATYRASPFRITRALGDLPDWTHQALTQRERDMVEFAAVLYCRDLYPAIPDGTSGVVVVPRDSTIM
jgi:hypothetical protein